jgi:asparagine synthase (glutamine-hydrolysing)
MRIDVDFDAPALGLRLQDVPPAALARDGGTTLVVDGRAREGDTVLDGSALLARYRGAGIELARGLQGAYAIAVVDADAGRVLLLNDRMAVRNWCYAQNGRRLRIAPRADTIAEGATLDPQALFTYLSGHVIPSPDTVFEGVRRLPPAHRLVVDRSGTRLEAHWQPRFDEATAPDFGALKDEFRALLRGAVARAAREAGGTCGTFLSGGTDSSTVSGLLREVTGAPTRAYSIGFDAAGYDEMEYARIAARHFGLDHREHYLTPDEVASGMPLVAASYDQPFGNSSAVAAYHCARVAREQGCSTLLAGDGGDELFGGNARYAKQAVFGWYGQVPQALRRGLLEPLLDNALAERVPGVKKATSYVRQANAPMPDRMHQYNLLRRLGLDVVLAPAFRARVAPQHETDAQRSVYAASAGAHLINRMLAYDWRYTLADNDLPKVVGTTGLAGVAAAFPMLADELIDFSLRLPHAYKVKGLKLRWFFKEALRGFLPDATITKKKQGFGLPFGVWALRHAPLAKLADDALAGFATRGVIEPAFMKRLRHELLPAHPGYYGELVWVIAMLELWLREHRPDFRVADR